MAQADLYSRMYNFDGYFYTIREPHNFYDPNEARYRGEATLPDRSTIVEYHRDLGVLRDVLERKIRAQLS